MNQVILYLFIMLVALVFAIRSGCEASNLPNIPTPNCNPKAAAVTVCIVWCIIGLVALVCVFCSLSKHKGGLLCSKLQ